MLIQSYTQKYEREIGIELLRVVLCFWIVLVHCLSSSKLTTLVQSNNYHVPCFIFISFFFFYNTLSRRNINKINNRFIRLLIPFWSWPIIIWIFNNIIFFFFSLNRFNRFLTTNELKIQLLLGRSFHAQLWFLFNLILFNLFFFIIAFIFNNFLIILQLLGFFFYILQYSGISLKFFDNYNPCIRYSLGHCVATYPIAVISLSFASINLIHKLKFHPIKTLLFSFLLIFIIFKYEVFTIITGYYGFKKAVVSLLIFIIFSSISLEKIDSKIFKIIIKRFTLYTQGIFCLHNIIRFYLIRLFKIKNVGINECIIVYITSYLICLIGTKFFQYSIFKYLFN